MKQPAISEIINIINTNIEGVNITDAQVEDDLQEHDMDSIKFIHMIVLIEEVFECEFPDSKLIFSELNTVRKIMNTLEELYEKDLSK